MSDAVYPAPVRKDFNRNFWDAIEDGQLLLQRCAECDHIPYPPRSKCPSCFEDLEWFEASGSGTVYSYGIVHRPNQPEVFDSLVPLTIAIVELDEGPLFVSAIVGCESEDVAIGDRVQAVFETVADEVKLPKFELN